MKELNNRNSPNTSEANESQNRSQEIISKEKKNIIPDNQSNKDLNIFHNKFNSSKLSINITTKESNIIHKNLNHNKKESEEIYKDKDKDINYDTFKQKAPSRHKSFKSYNRIPQKLILSHPEYNFLNSKKQNLNETAQFYSNKKTKRANLDKVFLINFNKNNIMDKQNNVNFGINNKESLKNKLSANKIMKLTKSVVKHNRKFNNYLNNYYNFTQINSFKSPETLNYPIYKNLEYVSLKTLNETRFNNESKIININLLSKMNETGSKDNNNVLHNETNIIFENTRKKYNSLYNGFFNIDKFDKTINCNNDATSSNNNHRFTYTTNASQNNNTMYGNNGNIFPKIKENNTFIDFSNSGDGRVHINTDVFTDMSINNIASTTKHGNFNYLNTSPSMINSQHLNTTKSVAFKDNLSKYKNASHMKSYSFCSTILKNSSNTNLNDGNEKIEIPITFFSSFIDINAYTNSQTSNNNINIGNNVDYDNKHNKYTHHKIISSYGNNPLSAINTDNSSNYTSQNFNNLSSYISPINSNFKNKKSAFFINNDNNKINNYNATEGYKPIYEDLNTRTYNYNNTKGSSISKAFNFDEGEKDKEKKNLKKSSNKILHFNMNNDSIVYSQPSNQDTKFSHIPNISPLMSYNTNNNKNNMNNTSVIKPSSLEYYKNIFQDWNYFSYLETKFDEISTTSFDNFDYEFTKNYSLNKNLNSNSKNILNNLLENNDSDDYNQVRLNLDSLLITIIDDDKNLVYSQKLPFQFLIIFYSIKDQEFLKLLSQLLELREKKDDNDTSKKDINNDNNDYYDKDYNIENKEENNDDNKPTYAETEFSINNPDFKINWNNFIYALNMIYTKPTKSKTKIVYNPNSSNDQKRSVNNNYTNSISAALNTSLNNLNINENKNSGFLNNNKSFNNSNTNNLSKLKISKTHYTHNKLAIDFIDHNKRYLITIETPKVELIHKHKIIIKYLKPEIILFLLNKNFRYWDFYLLNYLGEIKKLRDEFSELFSAKYLFKNLLLKNSKLCSSNAYSINKEEYNDTIDDYNDNKANNAVIKENQDPSFFNLNSKNKKSHLNADLFSNASSEKKIYLDTQLTKYVSADDLEYKFIVVGNQGIVFQKITPCFIIVEKSEKEINMIDNQQEEPIKSHIYYREFMFNLKHITKIEKIKNYYKLEDYFKKFFKAKVELDTVSILDSVLKNERKRKNTNQSHLSSTKNDNDSNKNVNNNTNSINLINEKDFISLNYIKENQEDKRNSNKELTTADLVHKDKLNSNESNINLNKAHSINNNNNSNNSRTNSKTNSNKDLINKSDNKQSSKSLKNIELTNTPNSNNNINLKHFNTNFINNNKEIFEINENSESSHTTSDLESYYLDSVQKETETDKDLKENFRNRITPHGNNSIAIRAAAKKNTNNIKKIKTFKKSSTKNISYFNTNNTNTNSNYNKSITSAAKNNKLNSFASKKTIQLNANVLNSNINTNVCNNYQEVCNNGTNVVSCIKPSNTKYKIEIYFNYNFFNLINTELFEFFPKKTNINNEKKSNPNAKSFNFSALSSTTTPLLFAKQAIVSNSQFQNNIDSSNSINLTNNFNNILNSDIFDKKIGFYGDNSNVPSFHNKTNSVSHYNNMSHFSIKKENSIHNIPNNTSTIAILNTNLNQINTNTNTNSYKDTHSLDINILKERYNFKIKEIKDTSISRFCISEQGRVNTETYRPLDKIIIQELTKLPFNKWYTVIVKFNNFFKRNIKENINHKNYNKTIELINAGNISHSGSSAFGFKKINKYLDSNISSFGGLIKSNIQKLTNSNKHTFYNNGRVGTIRNSMSGIISSNLLQNAQITSSNNEHNISRKYSLYSNLPINLSTNLNSLKHNTTTENNDMGGKIEMANPNIRNSITITRRGSTVSNKKAFFKMSTYNNKNKDNLFGAKKPKNSSSNINNVTDAQGLNQNNNTIEYNNESSVNNTNRNLKSPILNDENKRGSKKEILLEGKIQIPNKLSNNELRKINEFKSNISSLTLQKVKAKAKNLKDLSAL